MVRPFSRLLSAAGTDRRRETETRVPLAAGGGVSASDWDHVSWAVMLAENQDACRTVCGCALAVRGRLAAQGWLAASATLRQGAAEAQGPRVGCRLQRRSRNGGLGGPSDRGSGTGPAEASLQHRAARPRSPGGWSWSWSGRLAGCRRDARANRTRHILSSRPLVAEGGDDGAGLSRRLSYLLSSAARSLLSLTRPRPLSPRSLFPCRTSPSFGPAHPPAPWHSPPSPAAPCAASSPPLQPPRPSPPPAPQNSQRSSGETTTSPSTARTRIPSRARGT